MAVFLLQKYNRFDRECRIIVYGELARISKETIEAHFKVISWDLPEETVKTGKNYQIG
jgi:hypothetical protein